MRRPIWFFLVALSAFGCGGVEVGAVRHEDGPGRHDAGIKSIARDSGSSHYVGSSGDASNLADTAPRGCTTVDSSGDWSSALSCDGLDGCTVSGVQLAPSSNGAHAFGIASSADGTKRVVWERMLDAQGRTVETNLLSHIADTVSVPTLPDQVLVYDVPDVGLVLGLSGLTTSNQDFRSDWAAIPGPQAPSFGGGSSHSATVRLLTILMSKDGGVWVQGTVDAHSNFLWGTVTGGWDSGDMGPHGVILAAVRQQGETHWYGTRTDLPAIMGVPPTSAYARLSDFVTTSGGAGLWTVDLDVHSIVRMRANADQATLVAGVLASGALDVRRLDPDGKTAWSASPTVETPDSLAIAHDNTGGGVVAWNVTPADGSGPHIVLQRFASDRRSCTERRFPGVATDVLVRADDRIVLATDRAVLQVAP